MADKLFDESIFLRVMELKKGTIQYTDATNAYRLMKEHGRDIRYFPAWKKWLVWNGRGSLTLLYQTYVRCNNEMPYVSKETAFDVLNYRYRMYAKVLEIGGFS